MSKKRIVVNAPRKGDKGGFRKTGRKAANPSDAGTSGLPTVTTPVAPSAPVETSSTALPIGNVWSEYVKLGEVKKSPQATVARKPAKKQRPIAETSPRPAPAPPVPARRSAPIMKQTISSYYGEKNAHHAAIRMELTRATMMLSKTVKASRPDMVQALPHTARRIASLIHQYDPLVHGGEPNVMSDRTRATAAWIVNHKERNLIVLDSQSGKHYLDPHVSRLLLSVETDLKKNPALREAHEKGKPVHGDLVFSR